MSGKIITVVFAAMVAGLSMLNLAAPVRLFSENENRYLQQLPKYSGSALVSGKYTADIDTFVTDQFVFRDGWVGLKTLSEAALGKKSAGGVYFAEDGYLIEMFDTVDEKGYARNLEHLAAFAGICESKGIPARTILAPTASMILADKLPAFAPELSQRDMLDAAAAMVPGFVDVSGALSAHADEYVYYRTDHHWTSLGAFYAYNAWRAEKGLAEKPPGSYVRQVLSDSFLGTTYSKASFYTARPDEITAFLPAEPVGIVVDYNQGETVTDSIYEPSFLEVKDKYSVFLNANQSVSHITTENQNGERLLVVKDSYANCFVQMLLPDYEEIYVVDLRYYKASISDFIDANGITEALVLYNLKGFAADANPFYLTR